MIFSAAFPPGCDKGEAKMTEKKKRGPRGAGSVYQNKHTKFWTLQYKGADGKRIHEPAGTTLKGVAQARLRAAVARVNSGGSGYVSDRNAVKVRDLYESLVASTELRSEGKRSVEGLGWRWQHLEPVFGDVPAAKVSFASIEKYQAKRKAEGAANATINRETATLRKMFNLRRKHDKSFVTPHHDPLPENNTRRGFVEDGDFNKLVAAAEDLWLRTFLELAYSYGWRRAELLNLRVRQVNLRSETISLDVGTTKNGQGREVAMTARVRALLRAAIAGKKATDYVLTWGRGRSNGKPVRDFRVAWEKLFAAAGVELRTVHDFRRSAAKALRRAGVPESSIMDTGGWITRSMFKRYAIGSASDQRKVVELLEAERARTKDAEAGEPDKPSVSLFVAETDTAERPRIN
jgi:integrase